MEWRLENDLGNLATLTTDIETVLGVGNAYTLEVEVLNRSVLVNGNVLDSNSTTTGYKIVTIDSSLRAISDKTISCILDSINSQYALAITVYAISKIGEPVTRSAIGMNSIKFGISLTCHYT